MSDERFKLLKDLFCRTALSVEQTEIELREKKSKKAELLDQIVKEEKRRGITDPNVKV